MQFQVPQFIETEDKIVGPFSIRQFAYVGVGGLLSAFLYFTIQTWVWLIATIIILGGAIALAFIKIEGRPLANVIVSAFGFYWKPQTYIWKSEASPTSVAAGGAHKEEGVSLENILAGMALHKRWEHLQTGEKVAPARTVERKMNSRYQIFEKATGDRRAAKRVDYR